MRLSVPALRGREVKPVPRRRVRPVRRFTEDCRKYGGPPGARGGHSIFLSVYLSVKAFRQGVQVAVIVGVVLDGVQNS